MMKNTISYPYLSRVKFILEETSRESQLSASEKTNKIYIRFVPYCDTRAVASVIDQQWN